MSKRTIKRKKEDCILFNNQAYFIIIKKPLGIGSKLYRKRKITNSKENWDLILKRRQTQLPC